LKSRDGRLVATRPDSRDALSRALEASVAGKAPSASGQYAVPLPDEGGSGLIANVLPLQRRDGRNPLATLPGAAAVIIQNPADGAVEIEAVGNADREPIRECWHASSLKKRRHSSG